MKTIRCKRFISGGLLVLLGVGSDLSSPPAWAQVTPSQNSGLNNAPLFGTPQQQPGTSSPGSLYVGGRTSLSGVDELGVTNPTAPPAILPPTASGNISTYQQPGTAGGNDLGSPNHLSGLPQVGATPGMGTIVTPTNPSYVGGGDPQGPGSLGSATAPPSTSGTSPGANSYDGLSR